MVEVPGQEGAPEPGRPAAVAEREDAVAAEAAEVLLRSEHRASQGVLAEGGTVDQVLGHGRGLVVGAVDLLDHHAPLAVQLAAIDAGATDEVAEQIDRLRGALGADGDVEGDEVVAGVGVEHASESLGGLVDVLVGGVLLAALEHQVLEEVRHPVLLGALVTGPRVEGHQHRQRPRAGQLDAVDGHPVLGDCARGQARHAPATLEQRGVRARRPGGWWRTPPAARLR